MSAAVMVREVELHGVQAMHDVPMDHEPLNATTTTSLSNAHPPAQVSSKATPNADAPAKPKAKPNKKPKAISKTRDKPPTRLSSQLSQIPSFETAAQLMTHESPTTIADARRQLQLLHADGVDTRDEHRHHLHALQTTMDVLQQSIDDATQNAQVPSHTYAEIMLSNHDGTATFESKSLRTRDVVTKLQAELCQVLHIHEMQMRQLSVMKKHHRNIVDFFDQEITAKMNEQNQYQTQAYRRVRELSEKQDKERLDYKLRIQEQYNQIHDLKRRARKKYSRKHLRKDGGGGDDDYHSGDDGNSSYDYHTSDDEDYTDDDYTDDNYTDDNNDVDHNDRMNYDVGKFGNKFATAAQHAKIPSHISAVHDQNQHQFQEEDITHGDYDDELEDLYGSVSFNAAKGRSGSISNMQSPKRNALSLSDSLRNLWDSLPSPGVTPSSPRSRKKPANRKQLRSSGSMDSLSGTNATGSVASSRRRSKAKQSRTNIITHEDIGDLITDLEGSAQMKKYDQSAKYSSHLYGKPPLLSSGSYHLKSSPENSSTGGSPMTETSRSVVPQTPKLLGLSFGASLQKMMGSNRSVSGRSGSTSHRAEPRNMYDSPSRKPPPATYFNATSKPPLERCMSMSAVNDTQDEAPPPPRSLTSWLTPTRGVRKSVAKGNQQSPAKSPMRKVTGVPLPPPDLFEDVPLDTITTVSGKSSYYDENDDDASSFDDDDSLGSSSEDSEIDSDGED